MHGFAVENRVAGIRSVLTAIVCVHDVSLCCLRPAVHVTIVSICIHACMYDLSLDSFATASVAVAVPPKLPLPSSLCSQDGARQYATSVGRIEGGFGLGGFGLSSACMVRLVFCRARGGCCAWKRGSVGCQLAAGP